MSHKGTQRSPAPSPEDLAFTAAVAIYSKAFLEALGNRAGEGVANLPKRARDLMRFRKKGKPNEVYIGTKDDMTATVVMTVDLPDEARLALLDLDVTATELRGKELRWDEAAGQWRPSEELSAERDDAAPGD